MFVFFGPTDNWRWDPSFYYAQLRSPIIENDLDFRNETDTGGVETKYTVTGLQNSIWPIGPSILWSPFFLVAHFVVMLADPSRADGFTAPYIALVSLGSATYGMLATFLIYRICRHFGGEFLSLLTSILCVGATPLFFYICRQPIMAHTTSILASAGIVLIYLLLEKGHISANRSGLVFGVFLGLNFVTRWSGLLMGVFPLAYFAERVYAAQSQHDHKLLKIAVLQILVFSVTCLLTVSPQLALWYRLHNNFLIVPQGANTFVNSILPMHMLDVFLHTNRGLLYWAPFVIWGMIGVMFVTDLKLKLISILYIFALILLIGYRVDWYSGGGFGARYFIEVLPILAIGFVSFWNRYATGRLGWILLLASAAVLVLHQSMLVYTVEHGANPGWIDLAKYFRGEEIGLRFQLENTMKLFANPSWWFLPRPFVGQARQTMLVNWLTGQRELAVYAISVIAVLLSPVLVFAIAVWRRMNQSQMVVLTIAILCYMILWSLYLLSVG